MVGDKSVGKELFLAHRSHHPGDILSQNQAVLRPPQRTPPAPSGIMDMSLTLDTGQMRAANLFLPISSADYAD